MENLEGVLPAIKRFKDFDHAMESKSTYVIFLDSRISQIGDLVKVVKEHNKKALVHVDLVRGLKADEYGMEFLLHEAKVDGVISTRTNVITVAKKHKILAIQRLFLLDSHAMESNLKLIDQIRPDYLEVLPGIAPKIIRDVKRKTSIPIIAGGLIQDETDIQNALNAGAIAVSTSLKKLW
ncbi:glycerol-3-phosphate responsive antiterminator [Bacillaceae bacterium S4-13-58]